MLQSLLFLYFQALLVSALPQQLCRCMPTDSCWPSPNIWKHFNKTLGGKLVTTKPLAQPCHDPDYNATECQNLQTQWTNPFIQYVIYKSTIEPLKVMRINSDDSSSSIMAPAVANQSCNPFTPEDQPCTLGNVVLYSVNATEPSDFSKAIVFAKKKNIRLAIRNTGHEYDADLDRR